MSSVIVNEEYPSNESLHSLLNITRTLATSNSFSPNILFPCLERDKSRVRILTLASLFFLFFFFYYIYVHCIIEYFLILDHRSSFAINLICDNFTMNEKKSLTLTYMFALFGGLFGLHHLYLGRIQHAFLWLTTFGGCGLGFLYEFVFLIRKYVQEANMNLFVIKQYQIKMIQRKSPSFELVRFCGKWIDDKRMKIHWLFIHHFKIKSNIFNDEMN